MSSKPKKKGRDPEASVKRLVKREAARESAAAHCEELLRTQGVSQWAENDAQRLGQQGEDQAEIQAELELVNEQLLNVRRAEIKALYTADLAKWQPMLEAKGLSIIFDRSGV